MRPLDVLAEEADAAVAVSDGQKLAALSAEALRHDDKRGKAIAELALAHSAKIGGQSKESGHHAQQALDLFTSIDDEVGRADTLMLTGVLHAQAGDLEKSGACYREALDIFSHLGDPRRIARATMNLGSLHRAVGEYPIALELFHRALELFERSDDQRGIASAVGNIGVVYKSTGDLPRALECYQRSRDLCELSGDRRGTAIGIGNVGIIFFDTQDYSTARIHFEAALAIHQEIGDLHGVARTTANIANIYSQTGDQVLAREYMIKALTLNDDVGDVAFGLHVLGNLAASYIDDGLLDEARDALTRMEQVSLGEVETKAVHRAMLSRLHEHANEFDKAYELMVESIDLLEKVGRTADAGDHHAAARELAKKRMDFDGYVLHNTEYLRIRDEVMGQEATRKIAMLEAQKSIDAERAEKEKHRSLLYNTLPPAIADRVLRGETVNDSFETAAVMFMDMVGFTSMSSGMSPDDLVQLLSNIFTACDAVVAEHGLMKIKTIGDSYMCVAFNNNVALTSALAAYQMLRVVKERFPQIRVRIGLHCGPVTAGIIGTERLQYDVWGDTVNVASRMESSGEPGRIQVSSEMAKRLRNTEAKGRTGEMALLLRGEIEIKGKGLMETYWLEGI
ncbi:MAG: tetratricopeptide repeat protein [Ignavibacteria bacterium]|nr:tetratricopeptide repeat protein [Ignavibacteria bacterium]